ncbi:NAD(P)-binding domain-containing protein [Pseudomarimonas salicorniae]|uniref:NAD(P)-binding domain-containing protein n=1 Tax=Pseudomarimonas salicorniae TaxID=2933270 RepID=A0ABT0GKF7_9GAMM|nr:NAD(P)-binding domain-containing protein [Lysobacter sp. CAU 1642]MCK7595015.1 NAD(P)-binding domain-containing protein [Lysobacter sp. CAU 1642]
MRVAIAGFGDVGQRLARRLVEAGHAVLGLRRRPMPAESGVELRAADIHRLDAGALADWGADSLVVALTPDERSERGYRQAYVETLPRLGEAFGGSLARTIWVGSTSVYAAAETDDGWVDEETRPRAARWNGEILLEAEVLARDCLPGAVIARASGLYGPGRDRLLRCALDGEPGDGRWTNRLHVDDLASALAHLLGLPAPAPLYCLTDDEPAPEYEVLAGLRALQGLPPAAQVDTAPRGHRVRNGRIRATGWRPAYAGWREGYSALIAGLGPAAHGGGRSHRV